MFKFLRVPERLFAIVMALVSIAFAAFLIGLGSKIVADLPRIEHTVSIDQHLQPPGALAALRTEVQAREREHGELDSRTQRARLAATSAGNAYRSARTTYDNWLAARVATTDPAAKPASQNRRARPARKRNSNATPRKTSPRSIAVIGA